MRKFARLPIPVLALTLSLTASLPAGQDKVALRFGPAEGSRLTYSVSSVINVDGKNFLGKDLALNADSRGEIRLLARASGRDTVRVDLTTSGIDINARLPDRVLSRKLGTTRDEPLEVVFNRTGKVESIRNPQAVGGAIPSTSPCPRSCAITSRRSPSIRSAAGIPGAKSAA
jgi:hypothetical protein